MKTFSILAAICAFASVAADQGPVNDWIKFKKFMKKYHKRSFDYHFWCLYGGLIASLALIGLHIHTMV